MMIHLWFSFENQTDDARCYSNCVIVYAVTRGYCRGCSKNQNSFLFIMWKKVSARRQPTADEKNLQLKSLFDLVFDNQIPNSAQNVCNPNIAVIHSSLDSSRYVVIHNSLLFTNTETNTLLHFIYLFKYLKILRPAIRIDIFSLFDFFCYLLIFSLLIFHFILFHHQ